MISEVIEPIHTIRRSMAVITCGAGTGAAAGTIAWGCSDTADGCIALVPEPVFRRDVPGAAGCGKDSRVLQDDAQMIPAAWKSKSDIAPNCEFTGPRRPVCKTSASPLRRSEGRPRSSRPGPQAE